MINIVDKKNISMINIADKKIYQWLVWLIKKLL
jgi:hypothetical protein